MVSGIFDIPPEADMVALRWRLFFWDPWWLLGGALFIVAAWHYGRGSRQAR